MSATASVFVAPGSSLQDFACRLGMALGAQPGDAPDPCGPADAEREEWFLWTPGHVAGAAHCKYWVQDNTVLGIDGEGHDDPCHAYPVEIEIKVLAGGFYAPAEVVEAEAVWLVREVLAELAVPALAGSSARYLASYAPGHGFELLTGGD